MIMQATTFTRSIGALLFSLSLLGMNAQDAEWASLIHGWNIEEASSLCQDSSGNIYVTGRMSSGDINGIPVNVDGMYDIYLAKFTSEGVLEWVETPGGNTTMSPNERDRGWKVIYDSVSDAIYLSGTYQGGPAIFGPGIEVNGTGAFLAKYDMDGTCLWMRATNNGISASITVDATGSVYVTCWSDNVLSDSTTYYGPPVTTVPNGSSIAKYTSYGQLIWAKNVGINVSGRILSNGNNIIFAGGAFSNNSEFIGTSINTNGNNGTAFFASIDTACSDIEWIQVLESNILSSIGNVELTDNGDLLLVGTFTDSLFLPTDTLIGIIGADHPFYLRSDSTGVIEWVSSMDATIFGSYISRSPDGSFYLAFKFTGSFSLPNDTIVASAEWDFAVVHCQPDGSPIAVLHNGPVDLGRMDMLAAKDNGVVVSSAFSGTVDFGGSNVFAGNGDVFVVKYRTVTSVPTLKTSASGELFIYANPNNGTCTIELPEDLLYEQDLVLRILDARGRVVQQSTLRMHEDRVQLDIRAQARGTYVAEVVSGKARYTGRIVFE